MSCPADPERLPQPVLLTLRSVYSESGVPLAVRELEVGCIRSSQPVAKKVLLCSPSQKRLTNSQR